MPLNTETTFEYQDEALNAKLSLPKRRPGCSAKTALSGPSSGNQCVDGAHGVPMVLFCQCLKEVAGKNQLLELDCTLHISLSLKGHFLYEVVFRAPRSFL